MRKDVLYIYYRISSHSKRQADVHRHDNSLVIASTTTIAGSKSILYFCTTFFFVVGFSCILFFSCFM